MIAFAEICQETDSFNPILTDRENIRDEDLVFGNEITLNPKYRECGVIKGFLDCIEENSDSIEKMVPILRFNTMSGGKITAQLLDLLEKKLLAGIKKIDKLEAVLISMHGAMAADNEDDVEGYLLESVRSLVGPGIPIVVALDHHANITEKMMQNADLMVAHETQPHVITATGEKAALALLGMLKKDFTPGVGWAKIPMIAPQDRFLTSDGPMKEWFDMAREFEKRGGVIAVSTFPMQPWLDVAEGGWSAIAYTDSNPELANEIVEQLAGKAWELREKFWKSERISPEEAVRNAEQAEQGLIILSDTGDAVYGGAPGDSTCLLREMLKQRIQSVALIPMFDPEAVAAAMKVGLGAETTLSIGGKVDNVFNSPVEVKGTVKAISQGIKYADSWHNMNFERTVLFESGPLKIVLIEKRNYAINHPILYQNLGVEIAEAKMAVLKTGSNFQFFSKWRQELIRVDSPGMTQSDLGAFEWQNLPRPIYPLDDIKTWRKNDD